MWIINLMAVFGVIGMIHFFKVIFDYIYVNLPQLSVDNGSKIDKKLGIANVNSLCSYIKAKINLNKNLKHLNNITDADISTKDLSALTELKEFISYLLQTGSLKIGCRCKYKLNNGILDLYLMENGTILKNSVCIRFETFTLEKPILLIVLDLVTGEFETFYSYYNTISIRFKDPQIGIINEVKGFLNLMAFQIRNSRLQLNASTA